MRKYYVLLLLPIYLNLFSSEDTKNNFKLLPVDIARLIVREIALEKDLFAARQNLSLTAQVSQDFLALAKFVITMPDIKEKMFYYIAKDAWITDELLILNPGQCFSTKDNIGYLIEEKEKRKKQLEELSSSIKEPGIASFFPVLDKYYKIFPFDALAFRLQRYKQYPWIMKVDQPDIYHLEPGLNLMRQASLRIATLPKDYSISQATLNFCVYSVSCKP